VNKVVKETKDLYMSVETKNKVAKEKKKIITFGIFGSIVSFVLGIFITANLVGSLGTNRINSTEFEKFMEIYSTIKDEWYFGDVLATENDFIERAILAMVNQQNIDPYLNYSTIPDTSSLTPPRFGIGVSISAYDGYLIINDVFTNSPAEKAGLLKGDVITTVAGIDIRYRTLSEVSNLIQGELRTTVNIGVLRGSVNRTISVTRDTWQQDSVYGSDFGSYGVLKITGFDDNTSVSADRLLAAFTANSRATKMENLVIDLRDNPGGFVMVFNKLADLFTPSGTNFGRYQFRNEADSYNLRATESQKYRFNKIVILINRNSASASESFAAALGDNLDNVIIVGENSFGKGVAQKTITFSDGSSFRYTYAEYLRPNGAKLHEVGVAPDIRLTEVGSHLIFERRYVEGETLEQRIVEYLRAEGFSGASNQEVISNYQAAKGITISGRIDQVTQGSLDKDLYIQRNNAKKLQLDNAINIAIG
jgi:carboxyl-terminal processing protease